MKTTAARDGASSGRGLTAGLSGVFGFGLSLYLFYPGFMDWDSTWQLSEVVSGSISNAHPPAMAYLWRLLNNIVYGPAAMLVLQCGAYWAGLAWIAMALTQRPFVQLAIVLGLGCFPPVFGMLPVINKDGGMLAFLTLGIGLTLRYRTTGRAVTGVVAFAACAYAAAVRWNAFPAVLPVLYLLADPVARRLRPSSAAYRRLVITVALGAGTGALVLLSSTWVNVHFQYRTAVPLWDLAVMSIDTRQMLVPAFVLPDDEFDLRRLRRITRRHRCNFYDLQGLPIPRYQDISDEQADRLMMHWIEAIAEHPNEYLRHRLHVVRRLFLHPQFTVIQTIQVIPSFDPGIVFHRRPGYLPVRRALSFTSRTMLFAPWIYALLATLVVASSFAVRGYAAHLARVLAASGLLAVLPLVIIAPSIDYRYSLWLIFTACLSAICLTRAAWSRLGARSSRLQPSPGCSSPSYSRAGTQGSSSS